jgi:tetratricopeptide (TPR) repeat protein
MGNILLEHEVENKAIDLFDLSQQIKFDSTTAIFGLIICLHRLAKEPNSVIAYLKKQVVADPGNFDCLTKLALFQMFQYDDLKVLRLLKRSLVLNSDFVPTLMVLAEFHSFIARFDVAIKFYSRILEIDPLLSMATKGLIKAALQLNRCDEINTYFDSVTALLNAESDDLVELDDNYKSSLGNLFLSNGYHERAFDIFM